MHLVVLERFLEKIFFFNRQHDQLEINPIKFEFLENLIVESGLFYFVEVEFCTKRSKNGRGRVSSAWEGDNRLHSRLLGKHSVSEKKGWRSALLIGLVNHVVNFAVKLG